MVFDQMSSLVVLVPLCWLYGSKLLGMLDPSAWIEWLKQLPWLYHPVLFRQVAHHNLLDDAALCRKHSGRRRCFVEHASRMCDYLAMLLWVLVWTSSSLAGKKFVEEVPAGRRIDLQLLTGFDRAQLMLQI